MSLRDKFKDSNFFDEEEISRRMSARKNEAISNIGRLVDRFLSEINRPSDVNAGRKPFDRSARDPEKIRYGMAVDSMVKYVLSNLSENGTDTENWDAKEVFLSDDKVKSVEEQTRPILSLKLFNNLLDSVKLINFSKNGDLTDLSGSSLFVGSTKRLNAFADALKLFYYRFIYETKEINERMSLPITDQRMIVLKKTYNDEKISKLERLVKEEYAKWCTNFNGFMENFYMNTARPVNNVLRGLKDTVERVEKELNSLPQTQEKIYGNISPDIINQRMKALLDVAATTKTKIGKEEKSFIDLVNGGGYFVGADAWVEIKNKVKGLYSGLLKIKDNADFQVYFNAVGLDITFGGMAKSLSDIVVTAENFTSAEADDEMKMQKFGSTGEDEKKTLYKLPDSVIKKSIDVIVKYTNEKARREEKSKDKVLDYVDPGTIMIIDGDTIAGKIPTDDGFLGEIVGPEFKEEADRLKDEVKKYRSFDDFSNYKCMILLWSILQSCCDFYSKKTSSKATRKSFIHIAVKYKPEILNQWVFSYPALYRFVDFLSGVYSDISMTSVMKIEKYDAKQKEDEANAEYEKRHVLIDGGNIKYILSNLYNEDFNRFKRLVYNFIEERYYKTGMWIGGKKADGDLSTPPSAPPPLA